MRIIGIDPGLVHTGIVALDIEAENHRFGVHYDAIPGTPDMEHTATVAAQQVYLIDGTVTCLPDAIFIEKYEPRSHFGTDARMQQLTSALHRKLRGSKIISNAGSKAIIKPALLQLLQLKKFPATHHRDLEAAARILVYGMLKDEELNRVLYDIVEDHLDGNPWELL